VAAVTRNLLRHRAVAAALRSRVPQLTLTVVALAGLLVAIVAGLAGTPVGARNAGIVLVWIAWWAALMLVLVPLAGRGWCSVCPVPAAGEWLQRGAVLGPRGAGLGANRRWPRALRNIWLQNAGFVLVSVFGIVVLTQPRVTGLVLLAFLVAAVATSLIFERRTFCRYLCPVGGFIGLYSQLAPVELRVRDTAVCAAHAEKTCYTGGATGYGCPWLVYPPALTRNVDCGLCLECLRTCPRDNLALRLRPAGADLAVARGHGLDEAFKACIMLASALAYAAVMLGPWGGLKTAAASVGTAAWWIYAAGFGLLALVALPGALWLATAAGGRLAHSIVTTRQSFPRFARALTPLGLAAWVAFTLAFVSANLSYVWPVLSDPLGWGWNLLGTANLAWAPYGAGVLPFLQVGVLLGGLAWTGAAVRHVAADLEPSRSVVHRAAPVLSLAVVLTAAYLKVLVA